MLRWLRHRAELRTIGERIYERIVAQARSEPFYRDFRVPDTMEGRFEMICLHLYLVRERLKREGALGQRLGQLVLERLISDMDDALRRLGYDMGVPRRVKKSAAAFGERSQAYGLALASSSPPGAPASTITDEPLTSVLLAHVYGGLLVEEEANYQANAQALACYVRRCVAHLEASTREEIAVGEVSFPPAGKEPPRPAASDNAAVRPS